MRSLHFGALRSFCKMFARFLLGWGLIVFKVLRLKALRLESSKAISPQRRLWG